MKRFGTLFVAFFVSGMMILNGSAVAVTADTATSSYDTSEFTLFAYNNLDISGGCSITGNTVVKNSFTQAYINKWVKDGLLYAGQVPQYDNGSDQYRKDVDKEKYIARGKYAGDYIGEEPSFHIPFKAFPSLENRGPLPENERVNITESGSYPTFHVTASGSTHVSITTSSPDQIIRIRTQHMSINNELQIVGPGKVIFYVDEFQSGGNSKLNYNGDAKNVMLLLSGDRDASFTNICGNFNVYVAGTKGTLTFDGGNGGSKGIVGNIYTHGQLQILSGRIIKGYVYAPESDVQLSGNAKVCGKLVSNNVKMEGSAQVIKAEVTGLTDGIVQELIQKPNYHVKTSASEGGSITAYDTDVEEGTVLSVIATPDEGYRFVRFEGDQPDANGRITVNKAISIQAIFEKIVAPTSYVNGLLGEYFDSFQTENETAIRVKRIDPQIAFNFGYDAPTETRGQIEAESFSERWTGYIKVPVTGNYTFKTLSDDGVKLIINGTTLIDRWDYISLDYTIGTPIRLEAGQLYSFTLEHQQLPLYAAVFLFWESDNAGVQMGLVPGTAFFVTKDNYDAYKTPVFLNELSRTGTGINKLFYDGAEGLDQGDDADFIEEGGIVNYIWGASSPDESLLGDRFSARMTGCIEGKFTETMTMQFIVDDGIRVWIDDKQIIDSWEPHSGAVIEGSFDMVQGQKHNIVIEYNDIGQGATCIMRWKSASQELEVIPLQYLYLNN